MSDTNDTQAELAAWELLAEAILERDEWKQLAYSVEREHNAMQSLIYKAERDEARGQRDKLAEALRKAISWGDSASHHILHRQNINWTYLNEAKQALQSLNQPNYEHTDT